MEGTRHVVVLGSSVARGQGCNEGWVDRLKGALGEEYVVFNVAQSGFATAQIPLLVGQARRLRQEWDYVMLSLSLPNEGGDLVAFKSGTVAGIKTIKDAFPTAKLLLCGPYPVNMPVLSRCYPELVQWMQKLDMVDCFVDFFTNINEEGSWARGSYIDAVHPNDAGQKQMFECIKVKEIFK